MIFLALAGTFWLANVIPFIHSSPYTHDVFAWVGMPLPVINVSSSADCDSEAHGKVTSRHSPDNRQRLRGKKGR
ncbi:MAG: hypothetical protein ACRDAF_14660, partial [Aeromonas veronii]